MNFKDLKVRFIVATLLILAAALLIGFSYLPWMMWIVVTTVLALAWIGLWEFSRLCEKKGAVPNLKFMGAITTLLVVSTVSFNLTSLTSVFPFLVFVSIFFGSLLRYRKIDRSIISLASELLGIAYIALPFMLIVMILYNSFGSWDGRLWLVYLIGVTKISDIGAYFIGKLFGKRSLCPLLSPKKTIEGAFGGLLFGVCFSFLYFYFIPNSNRCCFIYWQAVGLGALLSIVGQLGDLSESLFKRDALVKDSNQLPGFGGVLDLFDSVFFSAPVLYFYLSYFN